MNNFTVKNYIRGAAVDHSYPCHYRRSHSQIYDNGSSLRLWWSGHSHTARNFIVIIDGASAMTITSCDGWQPCDTDFICINSFKRRLNSFNLNIYCGHD